MRTAAACVLVLVAIFAGCATPPDTSTTPSVGNETAATPTPDAPTGGGPIGAPRAAMERFVLLPNRTIGLAPTEGEMPVDSVPERLGSTALYQSVVTLPAIEPWTSFPFAVPFEASEPIEITLAFSSSAAATATQPEASGFPPVGGWFGTPDRWAFFLLASGAPQTLEAGRVYTLTLTAEPPPGGFFVREGESLALYLFLSYQTADGTPPSWVVGGAEPAGFALAHRHFNVTAPVASVVQETSGELGPNPGFSGEQHPAPVDVAFTVPAEAAYAVVELSATPTAGSRLDADVAVLAGTTPLGSSTGPTATEVVVLGPGNLAAAGRSFVAHITNTGAGGTFALKVTAYSA